jgi:plastocyanin
MRRCGLILTAAVTLVVGTTGVTGAVAQNSGGDHGQGAALVSGSSATGEPAKKAKKKALKKCRKKSRRTRRKACVRRVKKKYAATKKLTAIPGDTVRIDVRDKYFNPDVVHIKVGDSLLWYWNPVNHDAHNVNLVSGPEGVKRVDFGTPSSPAVGFEFKRTFTVPGTYQFACSIHYQMTMRVEVSK